MSKLWIKNGRIILEESGKVIACPECPCCATYTYSFAWGRASSVFEECQQIVRETTTFTNPFAFQVECTITNKSVIDDDLMISSSGYTGTFSGNQCGGPIWNTTSKTFTVEADETITVSLLDNHYQDHSGNIAVKFCPVTAANVSGARLTAPTATAPVNPSQCRYMIKGCGCGKRFGVYRVKCNHPDVPVDFAASRNSEKCSIPFDCPPEHGMQFCKFYSPINEELK